MSEERLTAEHEAAQWLRANKDIVVKALLGRAEWLKQGRKVAQRELGNLARREEYQDPDAERDYSAQEHMRERMAELGDEQRKVENLADELRRMFSNDQV